ncbi:translation initiation factor 4E-binding 1 [Podarcis lilfordi]|uniref:Translation initiation factor 4E-binding 1 n=1 Tax=Podarcis lilfordi TaxID=74358 RepID=A0AA35LGN9_9SAUR|nr:translation initiation factor 4E-binding 1 [Podarcis lilfordi]
MSAASCCRPHPPQGPTLGRDIPAKRLILPDGAALPPGDYSTTPGGTLFGTTPGGTRIIYDRKFLMECRNSPVAKTPPCDLPDIPGVTSPAVEILGTETNLIHAEEEKQPGLGLEGCLDKHKDVRRPCWIRPMVHLAKHTFSHSRSIIRYDTIIFIVIVPYRTTKLKKST